MMNSILLWHSPIAGVWLCIAGFVALMLYIGYKAWKYYPRVSLKPYEPPSPEQQAKDFLEFQKEVEEADAIKKAYLNP